MTGIDIGIVTGCIVIATFVLGNTWKLSDYTHKLEVQIGENKQAIAKLRKDLRYAYKLIENAHKGLEADVFDIQGYLTKAPIDPRFHIRGRSEISTNSGADFLDEQNS
ncbi:hypothetical protein [Microcoleus sp. FACHB-672]|uniref:hypothetical protein n=1 Tax=Microcoleus sp. FACHB-672 TaxID=2692825 RepID=UPI0019A4BB69|nr:hypothetical protein [Microcoleus sp. FACHB-672]MBD2039709.1 hypothetical protein [Microcoleus sp. FACHB-672]